MPHRLLGVRMEPPVSVPVAPRHMPVATAMAEPPLEPPGPGRRPTDPRRPGIDVVGGTIGEFVSMGFAHNDRAGAP